MNVHAPRLLAGIGLAAAIGCGAAEPVAGSASVADPPAAAARSFPALLPSSDATPAADWPLHGRTPAEDRFSPLDQIHDGNVASLGLAWSYDTGTDRGLEATPIVVDGIMYTTGSWSVAMALDAATGKELWRFDPGVDPIYREIACCDTVNRGVAVHEGRVYLGTLDGRLIALDGYTGELVWQVQTFDQTLPYSITGAPRIVKGQVIIGNGGAEYGVRGYVSAYDAESGALTWRFYTVPGEYLAPGTPALPSDEEAMALAAATWGPDTLWEAGGGGTAWDSFAYDPELDLLYVGVGNGSPWNQQHRDPSGGDNLFLASIVALDPDDGRYVWHYQTTPGETWDFTATQQMILADLVLPAAGGDAGAMGAEAAVGSGETTAGSGETAGSTAGEVRKVLMQAPKNGFFYVLDRATGELISARNYVTTTWAESIDPETGRPVEAPGARYRDGVAFVRPSPFGGHNWQPMSFNPITGLVYVPAQDNALAWRHNPEWSLTDRGIQSGARTTLNLPGHTFPDDGHLIAWDPITRRSVWQVDYESYWNGGTLTTAGNLVFQGTAAGDFVAYRASDGERLWSSWARTGILAGPVSYAVDGTQYVAVMAGWGGAFARGTPNEGRIFAFALGAETIGGEATGGGAAGLPEREAPAPIEQSAEPDVLVRGNYLFDTWCARCHGGGTTLPDLRYSDPEVYEQYLAIVLRGARAERGMPPFAGDLDIDDVRAITAWIIAQRNELGR